MNSETRRQEIMRLLRQAKEPLSGSRLSAQFGVTRQVIVADIAILRAQGQAITATPQGYVLADAPSGRARTTIASRHSDQAHDIENELNLIIDHGGTVVDVTVEHPVYGEITGNLQLASRYDIQQFLQKLATSQAEPLLVLTDGLHLHTIEAESQAALQRIVHALQENGYLASEE